MFMEPWFYILFAVLVGTSLGSFLNVVVMRLGHAPPTGRSHCPYCKKVLRWHELIPVLSYFFQHGRCTKCHHALSIQYPLVEIVMACALGWLAMHVMSFTEPVLIFLYGTMLIFLSLAIMLYDWHHKIVPDVFVYPLVALTFTALFFSALPLDLYMLLAGPIVAAPLVALWWFSGGRWIGLGDAKIALAIGWFLGISAGFTALSFGFWGGAFASITFMGISYMLRHTTSLTMKSEIPFAPFLLIGAAAAYISGVDLFSII